MNKDIKSAAKTYSMTSVFDLTTESYERAFLAGHAYALKKASNGFEEWWITEYSKAMQSRDWETCDRLSDSKLCQGDAWEAALLSAGREIADAKRYVDDATIHIKDLRKEIEEYEAIICTLQKELCERRSAWSQEKVELRSDLDLVTRWMIEDNSKGLSNGAAAQIRNKHFRESK